MIYNEIAVNLCGRNTIKSFDEDERFKSFFPNSPRIGRAYIGSEYCSYLMRLFVANIDEQIRILSDQKIKISIVFPNMVEKEFYILKEIIKKIQNIEFIDEIVVNDLGSLRYLSAMNLSQKLLLGKLFTKNSRDPRIEIWNYDPIKDKTVLTDLVQETPLYKEIIKENGIQRIEVDYINEFFAKALPKNKPLSVHYPYTYVTSGNVCAIGSINKKKADKFKVDNKCSFECTKYYNIVENEVFINRVVNYGNAYLYEASDEIFNYNKLANVRIVYNPVFVPLRRGDYK